MNTPRQEPRIVMLLGVPFHDVTMTETLEYLDGLIAAGKPSYFATANVDFAAQASRDVELQRILFDADLVLCDGTPLIWVSRWLDAPLRERVAGSDLLPHLFDHAAQKGHRLFFLGSTDEVLGEACARAQAAYPGLIISGTYAPPFSKLLDMNDSEILGRLRAARPDILLVAFGCPKQEKWIYRNYRNTEVPCAIGIGASLDFIAGKFKRAPVWMRRTGLEWMFRLLQEPRRLFNRYLLDLGFFALAVAKQKFSLRLRHSGTGAPSPRLDATEFKSFSYISWSGRVDAPAVGSGGISIPALDPAKPGVLLDLSAATFLDSSGLGLMIKLYKTVESLGGKLVLFRPSPGVLQALHVLKIDRLIPIAQDRDHARKVLEMDGHSQPGEFHFNAAEKSLRWTVLGNMTALTSPALQALVLEEWAFVPEAVTLLLDLSQVSFMDSSGLGLLLKCLKMANKRPGGTCRIVQASPNALNVIHLARLGRHFGLESTA